MLGGTEKVKAASPQPVPTPPVPTPPANSKIQDWNLVGFGKKIDWKGDSAYMLSLQKGFDTWNNIHNVFRKKSFFTVANLVVSDVWMIEYDDIVQKDWVAACWPSGKIKFATAQMELLNKYQKHHTAVHELGHALGLADRKEDSLKDTLMYYSVNEEYGISTLEKATFDYLYFHVY